METIRYCQLEEVLSRAVDTCPNSAVKAGLDHLLFRLPYITNKRFYGLYNTIMEAEDWDDMVNRILENVSKKKNPEIDDLIKFTGHRKTSPFKTRAQREAQQKNRERLKQIRENGYSNKTIQYEPIKHMKFDIYDGNGWKKTA